MSLASGCRFRSYRISVFSILKYDFILSRAWQADKHTTLHQSMSCCLRIWGQKLKRKVSQKKREALRQSGKGMVKISSTREGKKQVKPRLIYTVHFSVVEILSTTMLGQALPDWFQKLADSLHKQRTGGRLLKKSAQYPRLFGTRVAKLHLKHLVPWFKIRLLSGCLSTLWCNPVGI